MDSGSGRSGHAPLRDRGRSPHPRQPKQRVGPPASPPGPVRGSPRGPSLLGRAPPLCPLVARPPCRKLLDVGARNATSLRQLPVLSVKAAQRGVFASHNYEFSVQYGTPNAREEPCAKPPAPARRPQSPSAALRAPATRPSRVHASEGRWCSSAHVAVRPSLPASRNSRAPTLSWVR